MNGGTTLQKLLIVDDEEGVRALVRMTLNTNEYQILEASDGSQALGLARDHHPDLVLLDVMLPDLSGIDICRELKGDPDMASTTIVMLTAKAQSSDYGEAEDAGADGYFTKPFSPIALIQKVESVLGGAR
jgi:two-component system, OmpR family, phosphate regulon response regulator PhoB